ncbi:MAG: hypothetical protein J6R08_02840, partial [Opitutales bacterium]|nr:hypothetical protein [Opitutales bacterium]
IFDYEGDIVGDLPNGYGTVSIKEFVVYTGEFKDGMFHGRGEYNFPDGSKMLGEFMMGELCGEGEVHYSNGDVYSGYLMKNKPHGKSLQTQNFFVKFKIKKLCSFFFKNLLTKKKSLGNILNFLFVKELET